MAENMAANKLADRINSEVFEWLKKTRYEATTLEPLLGGSANFIYRAHLTKPLEDGTIEVLVKHFEGYMAVAPKNTITVDRGRVEEKCIKELASFCIESSQESAFKYVVRTPKLYFYDETAHTQIQEYLPTGINLKAYVLQSFASPTPESLRPQCHQLGKALAQYITEFHHKTEREARDWLSKKRDVPTPKVYAAAKDNTEMQKIRHMTYYDWLIQCIENFPTVLEEAREVFLKVKDMAVDELAGNLGDLMPIHGDFSTGNILLPNTLIKEGLETPIFVVDWEMAQLGVHALDHGEMIGELYALWLYKKIDAGLWMVQGYAEGLGEQSEPSSWRNVLQVGSHLVTFGTLAPGWGTSKQVEDVARLGRDMVVNAWRRDRKWFEKSEFACFFAKVKGSM